MAVCAAYPAFASPAWMLSHADRLKATTTLVWYPVFALGLMASGATGAFFAFVCVARGKARLAPLIAGGCFFVWFLLFAATLPRMLVAGTWAQFEEGTAPSLAAQPRVLAALVPLWVLAPRASPWPSRSGCGASGPPSSPRPEAAALEGRPDARSRRRSQRAAALRAASNSSPGVHSGKRGALATRSPMTRSSWASWTAPSRSQSP